jgi:iron complex transport system substrate-binding protein
MKVFDTKAVDIPSTQRLVSEMGRYFDKAAQAESLNKKLELDMRKALERSQGFSTKPKVLIIHFGQASNIYLAITRASVAGQMIEWAGGNMSIGGDRGMIPLSPEVIASADPDVILLTDFGYDKLGSLDQVTRLPGVASTRPAKSKRIFRVEEHDMVYIGPRTGENVLKLQELIHAGENTR